MCSQSIFFLTNKVNSLKKLLFYCYFTFTSSRANVYFVKRKLFRKTKFVVLLRLQQNNRRITLLLKGFNCFYIKVNNFCPPPPNLQKRPLLVYNAFFF